MNAKKYTQDPDLFQTQYMNGNELCKQYLNDYEKYSNNADRPDLFNVTVTEWATKFDLK
jgi:pyruvate-formate lyase